MKRRKSRIRSAALLAIARQFVFLRGGFLLRRLLFVAVRARSSGPYSFQQACRSPMKDARMTMASRAVMRGGSF